MNELSNGDNNVELRCEILLYAFYDLLTTVMFNHS